MFIRISNLGTSFAFSVSENESDELGSRLSSETDFFLLSEMRPYYPKYAQAYGMAYKIANLYPSLVLAKKSMFKKAQEAKDVVEISQEFDPKDTVVTFYGQQIELLYARLKDISSMADSDKVDNAKFFISEIDATIQPIDDAIATIENEQDKDALLEIKSDIMKIRREAQEMLDKHGVKTASSNKIDSHLTKTMLLDYALKICDVTDGVLRRPKIKQIIAVPDCNAYEIRIADGDNEALVVEVSGSLFLRSIRPDGDLAKKIPYHSPAFYETIFEPVCSSIGNFEWNGNVVCVNHPSSRRTRMVHFNPALQKEGVTKISMADTWGFSEIHDDVQSKVTNERLLTLASKFGPKDISKGTMVRCVKKDLATYFGRTGIISSATPRSDYIDITVDFGRGLGEVVLTDEDLEPFA